MRPATNKVLKGRCPDAGGVKKTPVMMSAVMATVAAPLATGRGRRRTRYDTTRRTPRFMAQSVHPSLVANPPPPRWTGADHERCDRDGHWRDGRGGVRCKIPAYYKRKHCSREGCTSLSIRGGLCQRHGAVVKRKVKRCSPTGDALPKYVRGGFVEGICRRIPLP